MNRRRFLAKSGLAAVGAATAITGIPLIPSPRPDTLKSRVSILWGDRVGKINRNVYGHFAEHLGGCIYDAMWVGEGSAIPNDGGVRKDTIEALKRIHAPIIRWPGGCFADQYHWREGVGPRAKRPKTWNVWWGRDESNQFGTDEFLKYCQLSGAEPYICLNMGSGTPTEALEWMMYCNGKESTTITDLRVANGHPEPYKVRYWAVGNENWGCGGNYDGETYAREYARYVTYLARYAEKGSVEFIACGDFRTDWNRHFFEAMLRRGTGRRRGIRNVHHLSVHHYFRDAIGTATEFTDEEYYRALAGVGALEGRLEETIGLIRDYRGIGDKIGIALDEWGIWHPVPRTGPTGLLQRSTLRDALLAAVTFNSLNAYGDAISMANIAQTFNVLHCIAYTQGSKFALTPTYHVFDLYQPHMDAMALKTMVDSPSYVSRFSYDVPPQFVARVQDVARGRREITRQYLSASASVNEAQKQVCITLVNQHLTEPMEVELDILGLDAPAVRGATVRELTSRDVRDENSLEKPDAIRSSGAKSLPIKGNRFTQVVPAHTLQAIVVQLA